MVCEHKNYMLAALQVVSPSLECFNDCQQLTVVGLISSLPESSFWRKKLLDAIGPNHPRSAN